MNAWREILARVPEAEEIFLPFGIDVNKFSDYERLSALCGVISLCRGHAVDAELSRALGNMMPGHNFDDFSELSAADIWCEYNQLHGFEKYEKRTCDSENICPKISVEKYNNNTVLELTEKLIDACLSYSELVERVRRASGESIVCARMHKERFAAPNRYIAEGVFNKIKKHEKYNNIDINCLYSQILCEIMSDKKSNNKGIMIDARNNLEYSRELIEYMHRYNMRGRIFVGADVNSDITMLVKICLESCEKGIITPVIFMSKNDNFLINKHCLDQLASIYPASLIERVWTN